MRRWIHIGIIVAAAGTVLTSAPRPQDSTTSRLRFIPGSTVKVEQILGEEDKELGRPTAARTATRYGLEGTDLGNSLWRPEARLDAEIDGTGRWARAP